MRLNAVTIFANQKPHNTREVKAGARKRYLLLLNLVLRRLYESSDYNLLMSRKTRLKDTKPVVPGNISLA